MIDLRSDTVTKPTPAMRRAMADAEVGDDVYGEDPTVNRLQERAAEIFKKEAAIFVPTGSMGNQTAVKLHTRPGQEVVIEERGHIYNYEMAATAAISGALSAPYAAMRHGDPPGMRSPRQSFQGGLLRCSHRTDRVENSHNLAGGALMTANGARTSAIARMRSVCRYISMARVFLTRRPRWAKRWPISHGPPIRSCSVSQKAWAHRWVRCCWAKGLHRSARVVRKMLGGGMRQAGILAAAGLIAIEELPAIARRS